MPVRNVTEIHIAKLETSFEYLQAELERVNSNLDKINKVMFIGNGSPPLPQQIMAIQSDVEKVQNTVQERCTSLDTNINLKFVNLHDNIESRLTLLSHQLKSDSESRNIQLQGSWKLKAVIVTSVTAIVTAIIALIA